ncbi:hypothetical protein pb186bvf_002130 [Paramecium bursaria]
MYQKSTGDDNCAYQNNAQRQLKSNVRLKRGISVPQLGQQPNFDEPQQY